MRLRLPFRPRVLQLESTNDCMFSCGICMRLHGRSEVGYLSFNDFVRLPLKRFEEVAFHGWGEPLLHPELFRMVSYASGLGLRTSLITNGFLLHDRLGEVLDSPLDELAVGIYTLSGRSGVLDAITELISRRRGRRPRVVFDITILKENLGEIPKIVGAAAEAGADAVVLHRLFNLHKPGLERPSRDEELRLFREVEAVAKERRVKVYYPPARRVRPCIVTMNCLFITWDCRYSPCCFLAEMGFLLGNALRDDIFLMHLKFMARMRRNEVCRRCPW